MPLDVMPAALPAHASAAAPAAGRGRPNLVVWVAIVIPLIAVVASIRGQRENRRPHVGEGVTGLGGERGQAGPPGRHVAGHRDRVAPQVALRRQPGGIQRRDADAAVAGQLVHGILELAHRRRHEELFHEGVAEREGL